MSRTTIHWRPNRRVGCKQNITRIKNQKRSHNPMHTFYAANTPTHETLPVHPLDNSRERFNAFLSTISYFCMCKHSSCETFKHSASCTCERINVREEK
jgi:hypothetical protein